MKMTIKELGGVLARACDQCRAQGMKPPFVITVSDADDVWMKLKTTAKYPQQFDVEMLGLDDAIDDPDRSPFWSPTKGSIADRDGKTCTIKFDDTPLVRH